MGIFDLLLLAALLSWTTNASTAAAPHLSEADAEAVQVAALRAGIAGARRGPAPAPVCVGIQGSTVVQPGGVVAIEQRELRGAPRLPAPPLLDQLRTADVELLPVAACDDGRFHDRTVSVVARPATVVVVSDVRWRPLRGPEILIEVTKGPLNARGERCTAHPDDGGWTLDCTVLWIS